MFKKWASYNFKTHEYAEAIEPIHFNQFIRETGLQGEKCINIMIATSREQLEKLLQVTPVSMWKG